METNPTGGGSDSRTPLVIFKNPEGEVILRYYVNEPFVVFKPIEIVVDGDIKECSKKFFGKLKLPMSALKIVDLRVAEPEDQDEPDEEGAAEDPYARWRRLEIERFGTTVSPGRIAAQRRARAGEEIVPFRYRRRISRAVVRKDALARDFDGTYDRVCQMFYFRPEIVREEEDLVIFGRPRR